MECPNCQSPVPDGGTWCLYCGAAMKNASPERDEVPPSLDEAHRLRAEGLFREAITLYARIAAAATSDAEKAAMLEFIGDTYGAQGDMRSAMKMYQTAIQHQPTNVLRQKYDQAIDQLRPVVPAEKPARRPRAERKRPPMSETKTASNPAAPEADQGQLPDAVTTWRRQLTPRLATVIMGTAVIAVISALLATARPWTQMPIPPTRPIAITGEPSTPVSNVNPLIVPLPPLSAAPQKGKTLHYVKPRAAAPLATDTPPGGAR